MKAATDESALDALFTAPPDRFTALRDELVANAKASGRADLAVRLKSIKRPSLVLWLANTLARSYPKDVAAVLSAGHQLEKAFASGDLGAVRAATEKRHEAVASALRRARAILEKAGRGKDLERPLARMLMGASMDPSGRGKLLAAGRLQHEIEPPQLVEVTTVDEPKNRRPAAARTRKGK